MTDSRTVVTAVVVRPSALLKMDLEAIESNNEVNEGQAAPEFSKSAQKKPKELLKHEKLKDFKNKNQHRDRKVGKSRCDAKHVPQTSKNTKEPNSTEFLSDNEDNEKKTQDLPIENSNQHNEFIDSDLNKPIVMITFNNRNPGMRVRKLAKMLTRIIPNSERIFHSFTSTKRIIQAAMNQRNQGYKYLLILKEEMCLPRDPNGLIIVELPIGKTTHFFLNRVIFPKKSQRKDFSKIRPEINITNFKTTSDKVVAHMLGAVFQQDAEYKSKRVVTIHKQRDFIFFGYHKYKILNNKPFIRELGPKLTLQLAYK